MRHLARFEGFAAFVGACLLAGACGQPPAAPGPAVGVTEPQPITQEAVARARIAGVFDAPVMLTDGSYEGAPIAGGAARPSLLLLSNLVRIANLDESAADEAVALLAESSGGSGERIYLAVVGMREGEPSSLGTTLVGDRTKIRAVTVDGRNIVLDVVEAGPGEPACCPTQVASKVYVFDGRNLTLEKSEVAGTLSSAMLAGGEWTVLEIDREPLPADSKPPTLSVEGARLSGFGGCNRYTGTFDEPSPGRIKVGPLAATRIACPDPAAEIERRFLSALGAASQYSFVAGRLSLDGMAGRALRSLLLSREP